MVAEIIIDIAIGFLTAIGVVCFFIGINLLEEWLGWRNNG